MTTTTIDSERRAKIPGALPQEEFQVIEETTGFRLERVHPAKKLSREEVLKRIAESALSFPRDWEEIRADTREP